MNTRVKELLAEVANKYSQPEEIAVMNDRVKNGARLSLPEQTLVNFYFPFPCRVLDVGCSVGREAIALAKQGYRVTGVDISPTLIEVARRNAIEQGARVTFKRTDGLAIDGQDSSFDLAIILSQTIEHLPGRENRIALLKEIKRIITPSGFLFISAHDRYHPSMNELRPTFQLSKEDDAEEGDVFLISLHGVQSSGRAFMHYSKPDELRAELKDAGLHIWHMARHSELGGEPGMDRIFYMVCSPQSLEYSEK
jgi:2-polyprenyl-3-methyl-5-hydroxy-6-metoxy-1,4-benzoquinol methylase